MATKTAESAAGGGTGLAAYPKLIVQDGKATMGEAALSSAFHERNLSHLIGRRTGGGVWPDDPEDRDAVAQFEAGQKALYEDKDAVAAIRAYEAALDREPSYLKAWVALSIAYINDNTQESLAQAEDVLTNLAALSPSDWLTGEASSIIHQNLAYLYVHRFRQGGDRDLLTRADAHYAVADTRGGGRARIEYLCPWAYVKMELKQREAARTLWTRAQAWAETNRAPRLLSEYAAKYAPLRELLAEMG